MLLTDYLSYLGTEVILSCVYDTVCYLPRVKFGVHGVFACTSGTVLFTGPVAGCSVGAK